MIHKNWQAGLILASLLAAGCSRQKTIDKNQMRSHLRSALAFTAESDMFVDYVQQGRATRHYAQEHAAYLEEAVSRSAKELEEGAAAPGIENALSECKTQLGLLRNELSGLQRTSDNNALNTAKQTLAQIRESLKKANSQL
jgi:hypothetical protein